jgi:hypothetical protein
MLAAIVIGVVLGGADTRLGPHASAREIRVVLDDPASTTVQKDLALVAAIDLGDLALTKLAVERGADVQLRYDFPGGKNCQSGPPCGWRFSALDLAVGLERTEIARYLVSQGMDPMEKTSGGVEAPINKVKSDAMLQALFGKRYAELRYLNQSPTAESLAACMTGTANRMVVSQNPVVVAEVKKVLWVQRDPDARGGEPFPPDLVTLRLIKVLNAELLDVDSRFALLKHRIPDLSLAELQPVVDWTAIAPGREVSVPWPGSFRQRLRPPPAGTRIILSFTGVPSTRKLMEALQDPTRRMIAVEGSPAVGRCFLSDSQVNRDAVAAEVDQALAREAESIQRDRAFHAQASARQRRVDECAQDLCEHFDGRWNPTRRPSCSLPLPPVDWDAVLPDRNAECARSGGQVGQFSSTCQNECVFEAPETCGQMITTGCHCGAHRCWLDQPGGRVGTCVESPPWNRQFNAGSYY